jgi:hypothetical protein
MAKLQSVSIFIRRYSNSKDKLTEKLITECIPYEYEAAQKAYHYAQRILKKRWKEGEKCVLKVPRIAYLYARNIIKGRWIEAEDVIADDEYASYYYAKYILKKGRFEKFEKKLAQKQKGPRWRQDTYLYLYARDIMKQRLPKNQERRIVNCRCGHTASAYAVEVMKKRWKAAEKSIVTSNHESIDRYIRSLKNVKDRRDFRTLILAEAMSINNRYWCPAKRWVESNEQSTDPVTFS